MVFFAKLPKGFVSNAQFAKIDEGFRAACERAGVEPTARQASKWRNNKGRAWEARNS